MKFNAANIPPQEPRESGPMPDGPYPIEVEQAAEMDNRAGTGRYLELVLRVIDGPHRGRKLWVRYTSQHESEKAETIGLAQIRDASVALGKPQWEHESELQGRRGVVKVGRQKDNNERNEVKGWVMSPEQRATQPHAVDVRQRNGQLAEVVQANQGRTTTAQPSFDEDVPF